MTLERTRLMDQSMDRTAGTNRCADGRDKTGGGEKIGPALYGGLRNSCFVALDRVNIGVQTSEIDE